MENNKVNDYTRSCYERGMNDYMAGLEESQCPFMYEHAAEMWEMGYRDAQIEFEATHPELFPEG